MDNMNSAEATLRKNKLENQNKMTMLHEDEVRYSQMTADFQLQGRQQAERAMQGEWEFKNLNSAAEAEITSSARLEQELAQGYKAAGVEKAKKDQWEQEMKSRIRAAREREAAEESRRKNAYVTLKERTKITRDTIAHKQ